MPDEPAPAPQPGGGPVSELIERTRDLIRRTQDVLDASRRQLEGFRRGAGREESSEGEESTENRSA